MRPTNRPFGSSPESRRIVFPRNLDVYHSSPLLPSLVYKLLSTASRLQTLVYGTLVYETLVYGTLVYGTLVYGTLVYGTLAYGLLPTNYYRLQTIVPGLSSSTKPWSTVPQSSSTISLVDHFAYVVTMLSVRLRSRRAGPTRERGECRSCNQAAGFERDGKAFQNR